MLIKSHVIGENGKNETTFRPISDVCIPSGFIDKPSWSTAARGIPGFYWIDWRYRKSLVRTGNLMGVVAFLKALGAATGPKIERIESNSWHNVFNFTRVSHGDPARHPNFPHSSIGFGEYTDYGLVGDYKSNDLDRWLSFTKEQNHIERSKRGEALLRTLEDQWDNYTSKTLATANGYYANGKYEIGRVPTRWVWSLQNSEWARSMIGEFTKPKNIYANTDESRTLLSNHGDKICNWNANNLEVVKKLGFQTVIPPSMIISNLQEARRSGLMPSIETANAYYGYLSSCDLSSLILSIAIAFEEGLLFAPGSIQSWWRPEECLRENHRDTFGDYCGYLQKYNNTNVLWDQLGIRPDPNLKFIERLLKRVSENGCQERTDFNTLLERTYLCAEKLLEESVPTNPDVPIYASGGWRNSSYVFTTDYDELATHLEEEGLYRWDFDLYDLVPNFQKWTGIINIEREAQLKVGSVNYIPDPMLEDKLHAGVQGFGIEVSRVNRELWPVIRNRIQDIIAGKVQRVDYLHLEAKVPIPKKEAIVCNVKIPAFYQGGNVYISKLTELSDSCVATALLSGLPLSGRDRWSYIKALTLHLSDPNTEIDIPIDLFGDGTQPEDYSELFDIPEEEMTPAENKPAPPRENIKKETPVAPPYPVDEYEIEKDEGGEEPAISEGGLTKRKDIKVRQPRRNLGGGSGGGNGGGHSTKSTEQRAVEIYREHVLDPENIQISDQRVTRGVGADIIGDDNIFRELKSMTGSADGEIRLTGHEYARAEQARGSYELVIVEYVWDEPVITIIRNPLNRLKYYPVGDVAVTGWKNLDPKPRIISLKKR